MGVFETDRPASAVAVAEQARQAQLDREINLNMKRAQRELEEQMVAEQAAMEKEAYDGKAEAERQARLEQRAQQTRLERARHALVEAMSNMHNVGKNQLFEEFLRNIITESLWIDDDFKTSDKAQQMISESIGEIITKCEKATGQSLMEGMKNSKLLSYIDEVITSISSQASDRIIAEAKETGDVEIDFSLNDEESDEMYNKLSELNPEQISQAIRDKVLDTVKDEKECGQIKAELFKELDDASSEEPPTEDEGENGGEDTGESITDETEDDANEVAESLIGSDIGTVMETIRQKEGAHKGYDIRVFMKLGDKEAKVGNMDNARECYNTAAQLCESMRNMNSTLLPSEYEFAKGSLVNAMESRMFSVSPTSGNANLRTVNNGYSANTMNEALLDIKAYCSAMGAASLTRNVVTESVADIARRRRADRVNDVLRKSTGSSLFEALMILNVKKLEAERPVYENGAPLVADEVENAAMINTVLEYTIYETLNTLKLFKFDSRTIDKLKTM